MNIDDYIKGLVHFVRDNDGTYDNDEIRQAIQSRFTEVIAFEIAQDQGFLHSRNEGGNTNVALIDFIETVEDLLASKSACLIEIRVGKLECENQMDELFSIIDAVQRVSLHYKVDDQKIKLFFVR